MHRIVPILLTLAVLIFLSCKKEDSEYWGEVSTAKNGSDWSGQIKSANSNFAASKIEIIIDNFDDQGIWQETLGFYKIPTKVGKFMLSLTSNQPPDDSLSGSLYSNGYDDALFNAYRIAQNDSTSYIEITEYNPDKAEIKGAFNIVLWRDKSIGGSFNAPDSVVFSGGTFHTRIND